MSYKVNFYVSEYVDGNLKIEPKHMHYAFREDLNYDNIKQSSLYLTMAMIKAICKREGIEPIFKLI